MRGHREKIFYFKYNPRFTIWAKRLPSVLFYNCTTLNETVHFSPACYSLDNPVRKNINLGILNVGTGLSLMKMCAFCIDFRIEIYCQHCAFCFLFISQFCCAHVSGRSYLSSGLTSCAGLSPNKSVNTGRAYISLRFLCLHPELMSWIFFP